MITELRIILLDFLLRLCMSIAPQQEKMSLAASIRRYLRDRMDQGR